LDLLKYHLDFVKYLESQVFKREPKNLYDPIDYILKLGGKRIRPILTLIAADIFKGDYQKALPAALAVETFHNFTLVHDDIMDDAPLRRGKETVHEKWDFENYKPVVFQKLAKLFSKTALEVCDGQQLDVDFETRNDVTIEEYIKMITLKTSVLVAAALKMGAIIAETEETQANHLYNFGLNLGIAFQLQDDYLDTFGNPETFGKQIGGDIIENKKTFLYLKSLEVANSDDKKKLEDFFQQKLKENETKIKEVKHIFKQNNIPELIQERIEYYTNKSFESIARLAINKDAKDGLQLFGNNLMNRNV